MQLLPSRLSEVLDTWLGVHDRLVPGVVEGCYIVGSAAFGDWTPRSNIDVVTVTAEPADDELGALLHNAHDTFVAGRPTSMVDGPYVAWGDLSVAPQPLHRPWTRDGTFHHDAECAELNPVVWYTLARYGIATRGPHSDDLEVEVDGSEREAFVIASTDAYWQPLCDRFADAVDRAPANDPVDGSVVEWCVLGAARMLYTYDTGDVTSKSAAGQWAIRRIPPSLSTAVAQCVELRRRPGPISREEAGTAAEAMEAILEHIPSHAARDRRTVRLRQRHDDHRRDSA